MLKWNSDILRKRKLNSFINRLGNIMTSTSYTLKERRSKGPIVSLKTTPNIFHFSRLLVWVWLLVFSLFVDILLLTPVINLYEVKKVKENLIIKTKIRKITSDTIFFSYRLTKVTTDVVKEGRMYRKRYYETVRKIVLHFSRRRQGWKSGSTGTLEDSVCLTSSPLRHGKDLDREPPGPSKTRERDPFGRGDDVFSNPTW